MGWLRPPPALGGGTRLGWAANGDTFTVQGKTGSWWKVDYKGKTAYIHKNYVKIS